MLEGAFPDAGDRFLTLPFDVPAHIQEIAVHRVVVDSQNIIDFGVRDDTGFRGWSGGSIEAAVLGERAASLGYLPGPIAGQRLFVVLGQALVRQTPVDYRVEIDFSVEPTMTPDAARQPYGAPVIRSEPGWYAGDFHVHSEDSGDATSSLDQIIEAAKSQGLHFVVVTDHNTVSHHDRLLAAMEANPGVLLIPGIEFTTYAGHATVLGATAHVDHRIENEEELATALHAWAGQGAFVSINHPVLDIGEACIGCAWQYDVSPDVVHGVEIGTGGWGEGGFLFTPDAIAFWDAQLDRGARWVPLGGSDNHRADQAPAPFQSPIGHPTTWVYAEALSAPAILGGLRSGKTVVNVQDATDPMVELWTSPEPSAGEVRAREARLEIHVTRGIGDTLVLFEDGFPLVGGSFVVDTDPFVRRFPLAIERPVRYRAEIWRGDAPRTVTAQIWFSPPEDETTTTSCGCRSTDIRTTAPLFSLWSVLAVLAGFTRRRCCVRGSERV